MDFHIDIYIIDDIKGIQIIVSDNPEINISNNN